MKISTPDLRLAYGYDISRSYNTRSRPSQPVNSIFTPG